jgi:hypothetical protein
MQNQSHVKRKKMLSIVVFGSTLTCRPSLALMASRNDLVVLMTSSCKNNSFNDPIIPPSDVGGFLSQQGDQMIL